MKAEYLNPFVVSTLHVFSTRLSWQLERQDLCLLSEIQSEHEISGIVGLSGQACGTVVLGLERSVALNAAETVLGEQPADLDADVIDTIGELANMVAGESQAKLQELHLAISLPNVVVGKHHKVQFPSRTTPICVPFRAPGGSLALTVGMIETASFAQTAGS